MQYLYYMLYTIYVREFSCILSSLGNYNIAVKHNLLSTRLNAGEEPLTEREIWATEYRREGNEVTYDANGSPLKCNGQNDII